MYGFGLMAGDSALTSPSLLVTYNITADLRIPSLSPHCTLCWYTQSGEDGPKYLLPINCKICGGFAPLHFCVASEQVGQCKNSSREQSAHTTPVRHQQNGEIKGQPSMRCCHNRGTDTAHGVIRSAAAVLACFVVLWTRDLVP